MLSFVVGILLTCSLNSCLEGVTSQIFNVPSTTSLRPVNVKGLPVIIQNATARNDADLSYLTCVIRNTSEYEIVTLHFQVFLLDSDHHLSEIQDGLAVEAVSPGETHQYTIELKTRIEQESLVAVTRVISRGGVWQVDCRRLEKAVRAKLASEPDVEMSAHFEPNVEVTTDDRTEILKLVLDDIIHDETKAAFVKGHSNVILLRESFNIVLPTLQSAFVTALKRDEIQKIANVRGKVVYLIYEPLIIEGSRVRARIAVRDSVSEKSIAPRVPYKYMFVFTCLKTEGRWEIEESSGYAQS